MSVRKRKWTTRSGEVKEAWIVDYSHEGQRTLKTFQKKKEADAFAQQVGVDIRAGTHTPVNRSITVEQAAKDWIAAAEREKREASTIAQYHQHAKHITGRIGSIKLGALTAVRVNNFRDDLVVSMSRALARKVMTSLKSLLREAQASGKVAQNVALSAKRIDPDKRSDTQLQAGRDYPAPEEIKAFIAVLKGRWRSFFLTTIFTGLRSSELRGLRWEDVDLKSGEINVRQRADRFNKIGPPKSKAGRRTVPIGPLVLNTLREWKLQQWKTEAKTKGIVGGDLVFPTANGTIDRHGNIVRTFNTLIRRAKLMKLDEHGQPLAIPKYTGLHSLRHFYASWCINPVDRGGQGLPPKVVQTQMGHSSIVLTMDVYGHLFPHADDASKKLAAAELALLG
jgi:integrase